MAWNVGYDEIYLGDTAYEGQWEVDADSEEAAKNDDLIPYLLVGVLQPHGVVWYVSQELRSLLLVPGGLNVATGEIDDFDSPITEALTEAQVLELAANMDRLEEGVTRSDFD